MWIEEIKHIGCCDKREFNQTLTIGVNEMQQKGLDVEIKYGHASSSIFTEYSALLIGRK